MDMQFFRKLNRLFHEQGWTSRTLGEKAGVSPSTISNWTRGKTIPKLDEAARLARALGVSLEYLGRDDLDEPVPDNLSESQRRILWLAGLIGPEVAAAKLAKGMDVVGVTKPIPDGPAKPEFVAEIPPSPQEPKRRRRRKA